VAIIMRDDEADGGGMRLIVCSVKIFLPPHCHHCLTEQFPGARVFQVRLGPPKAKAGYPSYCPANSVKALKG